MEINIEDNEVDNAIDDIRKILAKKGVNLSLKVLINLISDIITNIYFDGEFTENEIIEAVMKDMMEAISFKIKIYQRGAY